MMLCYIIMYIDDHSNTNMYYAFVFIKKNKLNVHKSTWSQVNNTILSITTITIYESPFDINRLFILFILSTRFCVYNRFLHSIIYLFILYSSILLGSWYNYVVPIKIIVFFIVLLLCSMLIPYWLFIEYI